MRKLTHLALALIVVGMVGACATQPVPVAFDPPGFFIGALHGLISPFALIASLFSDVRIYAFPNTGVGYDFGFMIGATLVIGTVTNI